MKNKNGSKNYKLLLVVFSMIFLSALVGAVGLYACQNLSGLNTGILLIILVIAVILGLAFAVATAAAKKANQQMDRLKEQGLWFKAVLDSIDFPIHVTDNDMKWTFMNRAFEKLMIAQENVKDRESSYGRACSNAGANICNTEGCGITQLRKGIGQSFFDWCGMNCKQDTSYLVTETGERIGFVEVVTDLTSIIRVNNYNSKEISRLVSNLDKLSEGNLDLDLNIDEADQYTKDSHKNFSEICISLQKVKNALDLMVSDTDMLTRAAVEGALSTRADVSKHMGVYRKVVEGVNSTLDAIVTPIHDTIEVLRKISTNDLEITMSANYKGTYNELALSINDVKSRLVSVQDAFERVAKGDSSRLEEFQKVGKRSENDRFMPAAIAMMQAVRDIIEEVNMIAQACMSGDLSYRGNTSKFVGGYREVIETMNKVMVAVEQPCKEVSDVMEKVSEGDLTAEMVGNYAGEYLRIKESVNHSTKTIRGLLSEISNAADQVSSGSGQVSDSSQALSQGATEQASSVEQLSASLSDIANQTKLNSTRAAQADEYASQAKDDAVSGNNQMKMMLSSMDEINEASANISKVIKVIEDIAFQTNILALNAAVEAARAGQYGKGFAVVADEVRNLAAKSADAAKETTTMIEGSIRKSESGKKIAAETAEALVKIVSGVEKASNFVAEIASASNEQATGIAQINQGIEQVSQVVQVNSATAEESAAASEELSSQADLLKNMIRKFNLGDEIGSYSHPQPHSSYAHRMTGTPAGPLDF